MTYYTGDVINIGLPVIVNGTELPSDDTKIKSLECILKDKYTGKEYGRWRTPTTASWTAMTTFNKRFYIPLTVGEACHLTIDCKLEIELPEGIEKHSATCYYGQVKERP
jgi:hypothetical protein